MYVRDARKGGQGAKVIAWNTPSNGSLISPKKSAWRSKREKLY